LDDFGRIGEKGEKAGGEGCDNWRVEDKENSKKSRSLWGKYRLGVEASSDTRPRSENKEYWERVATRQTEVSSQRVRKRGWGTWTKLFTLEKRGNIDGRAKRCSGKENS